MAQCCLFSVNIWNYCLFFSHIHLIIIIVVVVCSTCGEGATYIRTRQVVQPALCSGQCSGNATEVISCNLPPCNNDCQVSLWSQWSACDAMCGAAERKRTRTVVVPAQGTGTWGWLEFWFWWCWLMFVVWQVFFVGRNWQMWRVACVSLSSERLGRVVALFESDWTVFSLYSIEI